MSKINAVRLINLNYNNNGISVSDETFHLNGESTLFSLRNGGGKSVLVQMMMAPFLHKRYRDAKDRPFESYFTGSKPTFILVEWVLDAGAGYVLTGMMVRKNQDTADDNQDQYEPLEIINIISEYKESCIQDIHHLPVVERTRKELLLKNFGTCKQLFETFKRDHSVSFYYFDMNNFAQSRQYFDKLMEYQIHFKEWETIIKKVNVKESGLSDLFADCRDEKGLVEKWFLEAVESKLNKEKNRMKEFQNIIEKYVGQYKDNKTKIERRDTIRKFKEEAKAVMDEAQDFKLASEASADYQNLIAGLIAELTRQDEAAEDTKVEIERQISGIQEKISYVEYEKISKEIHNLLARARYHSSNMEMISAERDAIEQECKQTERTLHLLDCAKQQETVDDAEREYFRAQQKLAVLKRQGEDLEPERNRLGHTLYGYYVSRYHTAKQKEQETGTALEECEKNRKEAKQQIVKYQGRMLKEKESIAGLKTRIQIFDEKEVFFNYRYQETLGRSISGEYEPGMLKIHMQKYEKQMESLKRELTQDKKRLEAFAEERKGLSRALDDEKQAYTALKENLKQEEQKRESYDRELSERKNILRYLDLFEQDLFSQEKIFAESGQKLLEIERIRRELEKDEDHMQKEYMRLTQGKILELPKEFEAMLENRGIQYAYGMEWLKKNGYTKQENQKLVKKHPFLPYALILSRQEADKLLSEKAGKDREVYTSFPIPLIIREELQDREKKQDGMAPLQGIRFYVYFNENLLDEERLKEMAAEKERQIDRLNGAITQKKREYQEYFKRQEKIRNQKVSKESYQSNAAEIENAKIKISELESKIGKKTEEIVELEQSVKDLRLKSRSLDQEIGGIGRKIEDFRQLCADYGVYAGEREEQLLHEKETERIEERLKLYAGQEERLDNEIKSLENGLRDIRQQKDGLALQVSRFAEYKEIKALKNEFEETIHPEVAITELEARFNAITMQFSAERRELETAAAAAAGRLEKSRDELRYLQEKYALDELAWKETVYNRSEEMHQEAIFQDLLIKKRGKELEWSSEDKAVALIHQQIADQRKRMAEECQKEEPLPQEAIVTEDFDAKINQLYYESAEKQKAKEAVIKKIHGYENNLTSLAEYTNFTLNMPIEWEEDFAGMNRRELDEFRGKLVRSYRESLEEKRKCQDRLTKELNRLLRMEQFQEDFYRKPLENLLDLADDAKGIITQLNTTVSSYDSLMEKLEVDISMVEKERAKIAELLLDYIREVHENLGKIDRNSTISVRDNPVKMLKIQLPVWETNEPLYKVRLRDFIYELTQKGIAIFEKNENAQEYFGTRITTKNLYDMVVGISNVQIRLYKIEEQREYAITWAEVARNSGGEGFLSAFVILSSLLYYMRKDDSDIFADRNEGKVLIMDNPFAQTNASHLLKPLMDMAKKTNTQLICLSGLGGESIYNRFDNIYVLNLLAASLRSGMQYLKAEHMRGTEPEIMIVSQVEVVEQREVIF